MCEDGESGRRLGQGWPHSREEASPGAPRGHLRWLGGWREQSLGELGHNPYPDAGFVTSWAYFFICDFVSLSLQDPFYKVQCLDPLMSGPQMDTVQSSPVA